VDNACTVVFKGLGKIVRRNQLTSGRDVDSGGGYYLRPSRLYSKGSGF
jgi:hypothetical protein